MNHPSPYHGSPEDPFAADFEVPELTWACALYPKVGAFADFRAESVCEGLLQVATEQEGDVSDETYDELRRGVRNVVLLFTDRENTRNTPTDADLSTLFTILYADVGPGMSGLPKAIKRFVYYAHILYIPWLKEDAGSTWDLMSQSNKLWSVHGAMSTHHEFPGSAGGGTNPYP